MLERSRRRDQLSLSRPRSASGSRSGADGKPVRFRVTIDGKPPGDDHGADIDAQGEGVVTGERLYQLVRQQGAIGDRLFRIEFLDPGVRAYAFTFG